MIVETQHGVRSLRWPHRTRYHHQNHYHSKETYPKIGGDGYNNSGYLRLSATEGDAKDEKIQCSILLTVAGEDAVEVFNTFTFTEDEQNKIAPLISKFEGYCTPKKNITFERHVFNTRSQGPDETIDSHVTALKQLAKSCEFSELQDSLIRDRIVCGIQIPGVKARLLRDADLTLRKAIDICRIAEISKAQSRNLDTVH